MTPPDLIVELEYASLFANQAHLELHYPEGGKRIFNLDIRQLVSVLREELKEEGRVYEPTEGFRLTFWRAAYKKDDVLIQLDIGNRRWWLYSSLILGGLQKYLESHPEE